MPTAAGEVNMEVFQAAECVMQEKLLDMIDLLRGLVHAVSPK
jgi:hypothetical protein